jgi:5-methylcytosine-specific restriction protein A
VCGKIAATGNRCDRHPAQRRPDNRPSASARGYGKSWQELRSTVPRPRWCPCGKELTSHLDHIVPRAQGGNDDPSNLQWLGRSCHSKKTAGQDGGFGNAPKKADLKEGMIAIGKQYMEVGQSERNVVITGLTTA